VNIEFSVENFLVISDVPMRTIRKAQLVTNHHTYRNFKAFNFIYKQDAQLPIKLVEIQYLIERGSDCECPWCSGVRLGHERQEIAL